MSDWRRIIVHADMDAFYASVEQRDDPELRGKPILIGPNSHRGVVLTASYEARPYGVGSAMPVSEARRRCPQAVMVPPNFEKYQAVSKQVMDVFGDFSPNVEALSLDEAFLDMSGASHIFGPPEEMGRRLQAAVLEATGLTISVGISGTKYVAKVASGYDKPNGLTIVPQSLARAWLAPQPVNRLWGVGPKTTARLNRAGFTTIGDIARADAEELARGLGVMGRQFAHLARAEDPRRVARGRSARSIGSDRTLSQDISTPAEIKVHLQRSAERIARRLRSKTYTAGGVRIRLKTTGFEMLTRQLKLAQPTDTAQTLFDAGCTLLPRFDHPGPFRLVGMAAFDLDWRSEPAQGDLFRRSTQRELEATIDRLAERFGADTVVRARDLSHHGTVIKNGMNLDYLDYREGERVSKPG